MAWTSSDLGALRLAHQLEKLVMLHSCLLRSSMKVVKYLRTPRDLDPGRPRSATCSTPVGPTCQNRGRLSTSVPCFRPSHQPLPSARSLAPGSQLPFDRSHAFLSRSPRGVDIRPSQPLLLAIPSPTTPRLPHLVPRTPQTVQSPPFPLFFLFFVFRFPFFILSLFCLRILPSTPWLLSSCELVSKCCRVVSWVLWGVLLLVNWRPKIWDLGV